MYIKRINNVVGYKGLPDGFNADFSEYKTYIVGGNFKGKSTIGSLFNWCLTGTNLFGNEKEQVANDNNQVSNVIVDITFEDNNGLEHRIIRNKGKTTTLMLDGKEIEQGMLAQYYRDRDIFLAAHNPYYFNTLEPKARRNLIQKAVPEVNPKIIFNLLSTEEKEIIGEPIEFLNAYTDKKQEEISNMEKEINRNSGELEAYKHIALSQEGELITFEKEEELQNLSDRYEEISKDFGNSTLEDLEKSIKKIEDQINKIINKDFAEIKETYEKENKKLQGFKEEKPLCPSCRQQINDSESLAHLIRFQQKQIDNLKNKANSLKEEATLLTKQKESKLEIYNKLNTIDMEQLTNEKKQISNQIEILQKEKNNILLHNAAVMSRQEQVREAKKMIALIENTQEELKNSIAKNKIQKQIAIKLKRLSIEKQQELVNKYLNKVSIVFSKINKSNDNITECCDIHYEGREYKKLSKSQQARADLEISNLFNNLSGINAPVFFDDAESTTEIEEMSNNQMIISLVIKHNPLEILDDYDEVLDRKQKSVEREIAESSKYIINIAA